MLQAYHHRTLGTYYDFGKYHLNVITYYLETMFCIKGYLCISKIDIEYLLRIDIKHTFNLKQMSTILSR